MKVIKVIGKKATILGSNRLYITVEGIGRTFLPKELGIEDGDILHGNVTVEEKTYATNADGTPKAVPLIRWEATDYTSKAALLDDAVLDAKIAAVSTMVFKASDLSSTMVESA